MLVREATPDDAGVVTEIYAPYVSGTAITFELVPPTVAEMARRIAAAHVFLVLVEADRVVGYAYAGPYKERAAYRWACEVSVYLAREVRGRGGGRLLYEALFARLEGRGFRTAVAGTTLPNDASVGLHRALGFEPVGTYRRIGWKLGAWHDVLWLQRRLAEGEDPPDEPV